MRNAFATLAVLAGCSAWVVQAGEGRPSHEKLNHLGLASLKLATDDAGALVRGKQFVKIAWTFRQEAGTDMNMMADVQSIGFPLTFNQAPPGFIDIEQTPGPVADIIPNPPGFPAGFTSVVVSDTNFHVTAGDATQIVPSLPLSASFGGSSFSTFGRSRFR